MEESKKPNRINGLEPITLSFPHILVTVPMVEAYHIWEALGEVFKDYALIEVDVASGKKNPTLILKEGA